MVTTFFTTDCTPFNLITWGFTDSQCDPKGPENGSMLGCLILHGFPNKFLDNSIYTWFPLQPPKLMEVFLHKLRTVDHYNFSCLPGLSPIAIAREYNDVQQILGSAQFHHPYSVKAARIVSDKG